MEIQVNRNLSIPIYTQIVGQIQFGIVAGMLPSGAQLPSIRDLARMLQVAPMTITQAYQELKQMGLIEMRPGRGTYVRDFDASLRMTSTPNRHLHLRRLLQHTITEAMEEGFSIAEISQTLMSILSDSDNLALTPYLLVVGLFAHALRVYADDIERHFSAERLTVEPLVLSELQQHPEYFRARLNRADAILTPLHQVQLMHDLLQNIGMDSPPPVIGLSFVLRPSAQDKIRSLKPDLHIGIVSRFPEFVNTMLQGLANIHPLHQEPTVCLSSDLACVHKLAHTCEAIVYATGANAVIAEVAQDLPADFPLIEYLHTPDQASLRRIHHFISTRTEQIPTTVQTMPK